jgi:AGCS family alanine or glycine:cation symporter
VDALRSVSGWIWGPPLIILLVGTGLLLTVRLRGLQFRKLGSALHLAFWQRADEGAEGDISHFQALMTALAATVGTGNIVGVATAIAAGGPGALFWMWMTGLVGMATKYAEAVLGVRFRSVDELGDQTGGPMKYLQEGIAQPVVGQVLAVSFAVFAVFASFGIGNGVQSQAVADALDRSFGAPPVATGIALAVIAASVILGGIRSIGRFTGFFVPLMIGLYLAGSGFIVLRNAAEVPEALATVFRSAFAPTSVAGGAVGYGVASAIRFGVARGIFSNESGLGTGAIAAAAAQTREPVRQALVSMTQTFIDTLVVCTLTGLVILTTGAWQTPGLDGSNLTQAAFSAGLPGQWGGILVAISLAIFAFSTMLGWAYYGERSLTFLFGTRLVLPYRLGFCVVIAVAATAKLDVIWLISDITNGLMAFPNLIGLLLLSGVVVEETRKYFGPRG